MRLSKTPRSKETPTPKVDLFFLPVHSQHFSLKTRVLVGWWSGFFCGFLGSRVSENESQQIYYDKQDIVEDRQVGN